MRIRRRRSSIGLVRVRTECFAASIAIPLRSVSDTAWMNSSGDMQCSSVSSFSQLNLDRAPPSYPCYFSGPADAKKSIPLDVLPNVAPVTCQVRHRQGW